MLLFQRDLIKKVLKMKIEIIKALVLFLLFLSIYFIGHFFTGGYGWKQAVVVFITWSASTFYSAFSRKLNERFGDIKGMNDDS